jgi:hypothetical protein
MSGGRRTLITIEKLAERKRAPASTQCDPRAVVTPESRDAVIAGLVDCYCEAHLHFYLSAQPAVPRVLTV